MFNSVDFKEYRKILGFNNQALFKDFLSAKDIKPKIDFGYIELLNHRLCEIFIKLNNIYFNKIDIDKFLDKHLFGVYNLLKQNNIIDRLNNQGRRKEEVYFSWIRGYLVVEYFKNSLCDIFSVEMEKISCIGEDDFSSLDTFKRTPSADLRINDFHIEIQSGFVGINDIKEHKVREAKRLFYENNKKTILLHFDLFNGQVAFVDISSIYDDDLNWITRQQMEGQSVFNIEQNYFKWLLTQNPPKFNEIMEG